MTDNDELLPCPFCKNEMHFVPTDQPKGWRVDGRHKTWCPFSILTHDDCKAFVTREAAAESWNTRAEHGTLIAGQVREAIYAHSIHADCADADWQAIADELNAELGSGTCELTEVEIDCGSASEWMLDRFFVFDSVYKCSCGETFGYVARNRPNFCPNCGARVVDEC